MSEKLMTEPSEAELNEFISLLKEHPECIEQIRKIAIESCEGRNGE